MKPVALTGAARELALAALFLEPTPARDAALERAADAATAGLAEGLDPVRFVATLERHGVAVITFRNLERAGVELPDALRAAWEVRVAALQEDALRFRLTLLRLVDACAVRGVALTLLKGASLALDLYPDPALRGQGDLDVLVAPEEVAIVSRAAVTVGLLPGLAALPPWWYRLTHFHLKLRPTCALLREVEVHWDINHPSLLVGLPADVLRARGVDVELEGRYVRTLDPLDRLVHLVTHTLSHASDLPGPPDRTTLVGLVARADHPLRLKWVLDIQADVERLSRAVGPAALVERAQEWGAGAQVAWALEWIRSSLGWEAVAGAWVAEVLAAIGPIPASGAPRSPSAGRALAGLDFRAVSLRRLGRWILPPAEVLLRSRGSASWARRILHGGRVLVRVCAALLLYPVACAGRVVARPRRLRERAECNAPERVLELVAHWRRLAATPRASEARARGGRMAG